MLFDDYNLNLVTGFSVNVKDEWFFKKKRCVKKLQQKCSRWF